MNRIEKLNRLLASLCVEAIGDHVEPAEQWALESIRPGIDEDKPVRAKLGISIEWEAGSNRPNPKIKASYSIRKTEEYESDDDLDQMDLFRKEGVV